MLETKCLWHHYIKWYHQFYYQSGSNGSITLVVSLSSICNDHIDDQCVGNWGQFSLICLWNPCLNKIMRQKHYIKWM